MKGKEATDVRLAAIAVGTTGHGGLGELASRGSNKTQATYFLNPYFFYRIVDRDSPNAFSFYG